jgi:DNA-binding GntR family transcriptional regulator
LPKHSLSKPDFKLDRPATTLRDQVATKLRQAIISGHFKPGSRLVERQMCELFAVSRTLVREALRQLEAEGWVKLLPYRGPVVATMTTTDVREFYEMRGALEGLAAELCAERASSSQLAAMTKAVKALVAAQKRRDLDGQLEQAVIFYDLLREAAGNALLRAQLSAHSSRLAWLRGMSLSRPERASVSAKEEELLMAALLARDGKRARQLCEKHIRLAGETLVEVLSDTP